MTTTKTVSATGNQHIDGELSGTAWGANTLTYSFPQLAVYYGTYDTGEPANNFRAADSTEQELIQRALMNYTAVANLTLAPVTESSTTHAVIRFGYSSKPNTAFSYFPLDTSASDEGGDVWFNSTSANFADPPVGSYGYLVMLHEIGHAVAGFKHPHDTSGLGAAPADQNYLWFTDMTYYSYQYEGNDYPNGTYFAAAYNYPTTLGMLDIAAIQWTYGANYTTQSGDTTYSWSPTDGTFYINGISQGTPHSNIVFMTVWDGGGNDTLNFSDRTTNIVVDLNPGGVVNFHAQLADLGHGMSAPGNVALALADPNNPTETASLIENAIGGSGNDILQGNSAPAHNYLNGGGGSDTLVAFQGKGDAGHDINGDGRDDVLSYNSNGSDYIGLRNSDGTFAAQTAARSAASPLDKLTDMTGDGKADIVELYSNGTLYVSANNGSGTFGTWSTWSTGHTASDKIVDVTGDGKPDVVQYYGGTEYVEVNNGSGFGSWGTWQTGSTSSDQIGDVNGDGKADLVQIYGSSLYDALSNGTSFGSWSYVGGGATSSDRLFDVNGDGKADLVQHYGASWYVEYGQSNGTFGSGTNYKTSATPYGDLFTGGSSPDTFVFKGDFGHETVSDFQYGTDKLELWANQWGSASSVLAHAVQVGSDVVISLDNHNDITLLGLALNTLSTSDFNLL